MSTDAEKCRMIAEFEGHDFDDTLLCKSCNGTFDRYPHDLSATMRAARRLPEGSTFQLTMLQKECYAAIAVFDIYRQPPTYAQTYDADPARAAFLTLSQYLEISRRDGGRDAKRD